MKDLASLGIGLSLVFGFFLLALVAELYYLLWWKKKRISNRDSENFCSNSTNSRKFFNPFCWKNPSSLSSRALNPQELCNPESHEQDSRKDLMIKPFGEDNIDTELMRLHNLAGPPRFLFTIKEETKEDLESEDGKSRGRSLSDILRVIETPFLTPLSSPFSTPPVTPLNSYNHHGFNPLFESSTEAELNKIRSSPPPKFKFLRDAEEKLYRRKLLEESEKKLHVNGGSLQDNVVKASPNSSMALATKEGDGSFITIIVGKSKEELNHHYRFPQCNSSSSQVLPLSSSPSMIRSFNKKPIFH